MLALIAFGSLFIIGAIAASGTAKLFMVLIGPGQLLEAWQKVLKRLEPERGERHYALRLFWYKRLGGCVVCTRQFFAELSFIVFCLLYCSQEVFPTEHVHSWLLRWALNVSIFAGYCGTTLQIAQWAEHKGHAAAQEDEEIIETNYLNDENYGV